MSGQPEMSATPDRGCDWRFADAARCGRTDLVLAGDGPHICTIHMDAWLDSERERLAAISGEYVTRPSTTEPAR